MKNVGGVYVDEISKVLVSVFCHSFEKLVGADVHVVILIRVYNIVGGYWCVG